MNVLVVGAVTCIGGILLVLRHLHVWRQKTDTSEDPREKRFLFNQMRRRVLTSSCIATLGFILALFHFRGYWMERPTSWMILLCCALLLIVMILFLAAFDILAVSSAMRVDKQRTNDAARELAREYHRLKQKSADPNSEVSSESAPEKS